MKIFFIMLIIVIFIVAYNIIPSPSMDLYRYFEYLDGFKIYGFDAMRNTDYAATPLTFYYFYIIFLINNYSLLGAIAALVIFIIIFNLYLKFERKYAVKSRSTMMLIVAIISVSALIALTTGVRQNTAWATLAFAVYYDFYFAKSNKINRYILYIIPILIHLSTLPFIVLRLVLPLFKRIKRFSLIILIWPLFISGVDTISKYLPTTFSLAFERLGIYSNFQFYITPKYLGTIFGLIVYGILLFYAIKHKKNKIYSKEFFKFYTALYFFVISSFFAEHLFMRGFELLTFLAYPLFESLLTDRYLIRKPLTLILLFIFIFMFLFQDVLSNYYF